MAQPLPYGAEVSRALTDEVVLEGEIRPGDCLKLKNSMSKQGAHRIYLASSGGNLREAMEIGRLIRALKLETVVPGKWSTEAINKKRSAAHNVKDFQNNYMCASACFFMFVAGISRETDGYDPLLGVHRPYLADEILRGQNYDQALRAGREIRLTIESYLREMNVPQKYSDKLFSIPPNTTEWISTAEFETDLQGIIPELKEWVSAKGKEKLKELLEELKEIDDDAGMNVPKELKEAFASSKNNSKVFLEKYIKKMSDPITRDAEIINNLANDAWGRMFDLGRVLEPPEKYGSLCGGSK